MILGDETIENDATEDRNAFNLLGFQLFFFFYTFYIRKVCISK